MICHIGRSALDSVIDSLPGGLDNRYLLLEAIDHWGESVIEPFKMLRRDSLTFDRKRFNNEAQYNAPSRKKQSEDPQLVLSTHFVPVPLVGAWGTPIDVPVAFEASTQKFARHWRAHGTLKRRYSSWKKILRMCLAANVSPLPMTPGTAAGIVSQIADSGLSYAEVKAVRECITFVHVYKNYPDPTLSTSFARVWAGITRMLPTDSPNAKIALTRDEAGEMIRLAVKRRRFDHAAAIAVGFEGALRGSEVCALRIEDVHVADGRVRLFIRRSKTDQTSRGVWIALEHRPGAPFDASAMVIAWLTAIKRKHGYLLSPIRHGRIIGKPLDARTFARMLKHYGACLSGEPVTPAQIGTHSLRAGWATEELELGRSDAAVAKMLRHSSLATLLKYYRPRLRSRNFTRFASTGKAS